MIWRWLALVALAGSAAPLWAAPLTEREAVQLALQNRPALRAAQAEAAMAQARVGIARAEGRLQLSANALATASSMPSVVGVPAVMPQALLQSRDESSVDLNAMAMLPLATGGRIGHTVRAAELGSQAAQEEVGATRVAVAAEARRRLAEWRSARAMVTVAQSAVTAQQEATTVSRQLFAEGKIPQFDLLRNEAALAAAQQQVSNAQADAAAAQARLAQALGVPAAGLTEPAEETPPPPPADPLTTALARRPDLLAAARRVEAARATAAAREAAYRPQVYAVGMADLFAPSDMGRSTGATVGVVAGVPILEGGRRRAEVSEAEQAAARAQAARAELELAVQADVAEAQSRLAAAAQNVTTASAEVASAEASYQVAQERYAAGKGTLVEKLDALRAQTEAQQSLVTAQAQYSMRLADLYQAMGVEAAP